MSTAREHAADMRYALIAKAHGMQNSLRTAWEARAAGIPVSLAFALVEQESTNGANVFGHDDTIFVGGYDAKHRAHHPRVTHAAYAEYKRQRGHAHMQGVGPCQLTYWSIQDEADRLGGCWQPKYNLRVAFRDLAHLIRLHGERDGIRAYNGSGSAATKYAASVLRLKAKWHARLS